MKMFLNESDVVVVAILTSLFIKKLKLTVICFLCVVRYYLICFTLKKQSGFFMSRRMKLLWGLCMAGNVLFHTIAITFSIPMQCNHRVVSMLSNFIQASISRAARRQHLIKLKTAFSSLPISTYMIPF
jgi:hypothetical protein